MPGRAPRTYRLHIELQRRVRIKVGRLGTFDFPAGRYFYTGSARSNLEARIARHLSRDKRLHWHIDYLLASPAARILKIETFSRPECTVNRATRGRIAAPRFGASDCRSGCGSHLKLLAPRSRGRPLQNKLQRLA